MIKPKSKPATLCNAIFKIQNKNMLPKRHTKIPPLMSPSSAKYLCLQAANSSVGVAALEAVGADVPVAQSDWAAAPVNARTALVK